MTATSIPALLEPIQNRLNAATPGPWSHGRGITPYVAKRDWVEVQNQATICHDVRPADAEFIAHAPTDQARLLAAIQAVDELIEEWRYKGEFGWGPWQMGEGPDFEGYILDNAAAEMRNKLVAALSEAR